MLAKTGTENLGHTDALVRKVWIGCLFFLGAFIGAVYLSIQFAGDAANDISTSREIQLVAFDVQRVAQNALSTQQRIVKSDDVFLETRRSNDQGRNFDALIAAKLSRAPFTLFGILDDQGSLVFSSTQFGKIAQQDAKRLLGDSRDLVQNVYGQFDEMKVPAQNGYVVPAHFLYDERAMTAFGFRYFDSKLHLIVAQPILPLSSHLRIKSQRPFISVAAMPIPNLFFSEAANKIGMKSLMPAPVTVQHKNKSILDLPNGEMPSVARLAWQSTSPKIAILQNALPYLFGLSIVALASIGLVGIRFATVLRALGRVNQKNRYLAHHCGLTNIANRARFDDLLSAACKNSHNRPFTLLAIDLDKFKPLNDTYGHEAGDLVLKTVASRLESCVGEFGVVARIGGDEFMVILRENFERNLIQTLADEIISLVSWPISTPYGELTVGCSIGIASAPKDGRTDAELTRRADEAMYYSKKMLGNSKTFAEDRIGPQDADVHFHNRAV